MKRKLLTFFICLMLFFSLNSCVIKSYATTHDDIYMENEVDIVRSNISFDVIIQYGTPFYEDGVLLYYLYRDIYYYPFYYNNYWYVRAYRRPLTYFYHRPYFRPHRYDYRFNPGSHRGFCKPHHSNNHYRHTTPNRGHNWRHNRPHDSRHHVMPNNPYRPNNGKITHEPKHNPSINRPINRPINRQIITPNRGGGLCPNSNFGGSRSGGRR